MTATPADFSIDVGSDQEHERLVADIYYRGQYVGSITEERGPGQFDFEHNPQAPGAGSDMGRCPLPGFLMAVEAAANRLRNMKHRDADA
jgi:hypothetical protein